MYGSRDLGHAQRKLFVHLLRIPHKKPCKINKFEVFSSSSLGAIEAAMVDVTFSDL